METIYTYKNKLYRIFAESKVKIEGVWVDCIIYQTLYSNEDGWIWVRNKEEFFELFKPFETGVGEGYRVPEIAEFVTGMWFEFRHGTFRKWKRKRWGDINCGWDYLSLKHYIENGNVRVENPVKTT